MRRRADASPQLKRQPLGAHATLPVDGQDFRRTRITACDDGLCRGREPVGHSLPSREPLRLWASAKCRTSVPRTSAVPAIAPPHRRPHDLSGGPSGTRRQWDRSIGSGDRHSWTRSPVVPAYPLVRQSRVRRANSRNCPAKPLVPWNGRGSIGSRLYCLDLSFQSKLLPRYAHLASACSWRRSAPPPQRRRNRRSYRTDRQALLPTLAPFELLNPVRHRTGSPP